MPSYLQPSVRSSRRRDRRGHRFTFGPLILLSALLIVTTSIALSSVSADARLEKFLHKTPNSPEPTTFARTKTRKLTGRTIDDTSALNELASVESFLNQQFLFKPSNSSYEF